MTTQNEAQKYLKFAVTKDLYSRIEAISNHFSLKPNDFLRGVIAMEASKQFQQNRNLEIQ